VWLCGSIRSIVLHVVLCGEACRHVLFPIVSLEYFVHLILPVALWHRDRLSLNRNEFQEYFLGAKSGRWVEHSTLPTSCADFLGIWEPQPLGNLRTYKRTAFNFAFAWCTPLCCFKTDIQHRLIRRWSANSFYCWLSLLLHDSAWFHLQTNRFLYVMMC
jgi:hypothetical protein